MALTGIDLFDELGPDVELLQNERRKLRRWFGSDLPMFVRPTRYGYSGCTAQWVDWAEEIEVHADAAEAANDLRASRRWARIAGQLYAIVVDTYVAHAKDSSVPAVKALPFEERAARCHRRGNTKAFIGRAHEFLLEQLQFDPDPDPHATISFEVLLPAGREWVIGLPRVTLGPAQSVRFVGHLRQSANLQRLYVAPNVAHDVSIVDIRFESAQSVQAVSVPGEAVPGVLFDELDATNILTASGRAGDTFSMTVSNERHDRSLVLRMAMVWLAE